jgi:hypothetical protein
VKTMNKSFWTVVAAGAALLLLPGKARAQAFNFTLSPSLVAGGGTVAGASGTFNVVGTQDATGDGWTITVTGNNDGNGSPSDPSGTPPKHSIDLINFQAFTDNLGGTTQSSTSATANTNTPWTQYAIGATTGFVAGGEAPIDPYGANTLTIRVFFSSRTLGAIQMSGQDNGQQWNGSDTLTSSAVPEPGTLSLAIPALLGLCALSYRRGRREDDEEPELGT